MGYATTEPPIIWYTYFVTISYPRPLMELERRFATDEACREYKSH